MTELTNHLWQSTVFAALVALMALALRQNQAKIRYALWLAASMKFLLPFSLLMSLGSQVDLPKATPVVTALAVEQMTTTFAPLSSPDAQVPRRLPWMTGKWMSGAWMMGAWLIGAGLLLTRWLRRWLQIRRALRGAVRLPLAAGIPVMSSRTTIEPGVFGVFHPVLLMPEGIANHLTPEQLDAILAHELTHVRRRDNLTAAMHMVVETLFWFHPLVWWIGGKLVEERERACDEAVLDEGRPPQVYAQGIVNVCKFYVESPLPCASGVSGADLRQRIEEIMTQRILSRLTLARKVALAGAGLGAFALPFAIGILRAQTLPPPPKHKFEVASIRPGDPASRGSRIGPGPQGGLRTENTPVIQLLQFAYDIRAFQLVSAPAWIRTDKFSITATPDTPEELPSPTMGPKKMEAMFNRHRERMQALLIERFGLVLRAETREMPIYALVVGKGGHKLTAPKDPGKGPNLRLDRDRLEGSGADLGMMTRSLSNLLRRTVINETGLEGPYDFQMTFAPEAEPGEPGGGESTGPSLFTAIQEQLGLKLESKRGPVPVFVVERIQKPSEN